MLVTEAEAKTKWCPKAFPSHEEGVAGNRWFNDAFFQAALRGGEELAGPLNSCLGSQCMFWRWSGKDPAYTDARTIWPDKAEMHGDSLKAMRHTEPTRPAKATSDYIWVPLTGTGDDLEGAFWKESLEAVARRHAEVKAARHGYCGLVGRVE